MKKFLGKFIQYIGAFIVLCGVICTMLESENLVTTLLVGFALLGVGTVICCFGMEVEGV